jgi:hypothetical protein
MKIQDTVFCPFLQMGKTWYYLTNPSDDGYYIMGEGVKDFEGDLLEYTSRKPQRRLSKDMKTCRNAKIQCS